MWASVLASEVCALGRDRVAVTCTQAEMAYITVPEPESADAEPAQMAMVGVTDTRYYCSFFPRLAGRGGHSLLEDFTIASVNHCRSVANRQDRSE